MAATVIPGFPRAVYIETSILHKLPLHIIEAEMERLLAYAKELGFLVIIPDSCLIEWLPQRRKLLESMIQQVTNGLTDVGRTFGYAQDPKWPDDAQKMLAELEQTTNGILQRHEIGLAPMAILDVSALFKRAVGKVRPFEEKGEKGFRDTVHIYSVLEHAKTLGHEFVGFDSIILIAEDDAFSHADVQSLAEQYGWKLVVIKSIRGAIDSLEAFGQETQKLVKDYEDQKVRQYLLENREPISKYIAENYAFPESALNKGSQLGFFPRIQGIDKVEVSEIPTVTRGTLPTGTKEGSIQVAFDARTKCTVRIIESPPLQERAYRVGSAPSGDSQFPYGLGALAQALNQQEVARERELDVPLFGTVQVTLVESSRMYSDLVLQGFRSA